MEDRLFAQLDDLVYSRIESEDRRDINRFNRDSSSDPNRWRPNWNRTFELLADDPVAGVRSVGNFGYGLVTASMESILSISGAEACWIHNPLEDWKRKR